MTTGHGSNGQNGPGAEQSAVLSVVICGAGGHAKVFADVLSAQPAPVSIKGFLDDRAELHGTELMGMPVLGDLATWLERASKTDSLLVVAIGDNEARERVAGRISQAGFGFATAVHPSASIGHGVEIGAGTVVMANAVVNASAVIGEHVIINTSASVDHDCTVEDFSHISPGVNLAGGVTVGRGAHIGIGACAVPGVRIGEWATVGAGATVVNDVPPYTTVVGTPAVPIKRRSAVR